VNVLARSGTGRDRSWTVWGDREAASSALRAAGASVRSVESLGFEEATRTLLRTGLETEADESGRASDLREERP
jgi:hypothetical protein